MKKSERLRIEKWFWATHVPIFVGLYVWARELYEAVGVLYLVLLSIWTQVRNIDGAEEAAAVHEERDVEG